MRLKITSFERILSLLYYRLMLRKNKYFILKLKACYHEAHEVNEENKKYFSSLALL